LIKQRLNASKTAYEFGTKRKDFDSMLTDETKKMFTGGTTPSGPAVGEIDNGYRFKGGDPSKAENWEKVE